jgi:predicted transcriptional regulator
MKKIYRLDLDVRKAVYNFISQNPGLSINEISKKLNLPDSIINNHLNILKKIGIIIERPEGRDIRYFVAEKINEVDKKIISLLKQDIPFRIIMYLLLYPNSSESMICKYLRRSPSTVEYHLDKLIDIDVVEFYPNGNEISYRVKRETNLYELFYEHRDKLMKQSQNSFEFPFNSI